MRVKQTPPPTFSLPLCSLSGGLQYQRGSWVLKKIDFFLICYIKGLAGQRRSRGESESGTWSADQFPRGVLNSQRVPFSYLPIRTFPNQRNTSPSFTPRQWPSPTFLQGSENSVDCSGGTQRTRKKIGGEALRQEGRRCGKERERKREKKNHMWKSFGSLGSPRKSDGEQW